MGLFSEKSVGRSEKKYSGKYIQAKLKPDDSRGVSSADADEEISPAARGAVFLLSRIIIGIIVAVLIWMGFNIGLNSMKVYVLSRDAVTLRTQYALQPDTIDPDKLGNYFTQHCMAYDDVLSGNLYEDYNISNYYDRIVVDPLVIWPWQDNADVTIVQQILKITGTYSEKHLADLGKTEDDVKDADVVIPEWKNGEYRLTFTKSEIEDWKIDQITFVSDAPDRMMQVYEEESETKY